MMAWDLIPLRNTDVLCTENEYLKKNKNKKLLTHPFNLIGE